MKEVRLPEICKIQYGYAFDSAKFSATTGIPLIRIRDVVRGYSETYTTEDYSEDYVVNDGDILIGMDGEFNIARWNGGRALLNQRVCRLFPKGNVDKGYLFYFMPQALKQIEDKTPFVTVKHLSAKQLNSVIVPLPEIEKQRKIVFTLDKLSALISLRKQQLSKLDELVKSRFIELFGTITENPYGYPTATLKEVCRKITDGKHGGCEQDADSGYYYVGAREIYDGSIHYDTAPQIAYTDFAKDYKRCNIECGDMVIVNTGATIGKTAIATSLLTEHTLLQKSVALLKVKTEIIGAEFLRHCYMANPSMYRVESASAQPNLLLSKINATRIYLPPLQLQEQFAACVERTDKSKLTIQKGIDNLEMLKKALMQEYFG